jgi:ribonuclease E/ribonuclease G
VSAAPAELLIDRRGRWLRAALVVDGRLTDLHLDSLSDPPDRSEPAQPQTGSLWRGRVERLAAGLNAAFIDLGTGRAGLLGVADLRSADGARPEAGAAIGTRLRAGQTVLVQIKAEAVGSKGPGLSMEVSLPGRFLVHVPFRRGITVSKRSGDGAARAALTRRIRELAVGEGWIARAAAAAAPDPLIVAESELLALAWRDVQRQAAAGSTPACLLPTPDAGRRAVIGHGGRPLARIEVETATDRPDGPAWAAGFAAWLADAAPDLVPRLEVLPPRQEARSGAAALFERHDLDGQIVALTGARVPLRDGAGLVIEHTEALTAIDVNAGERGNPLAVNLEAAAEIARQLRLRNIGGIVVVDFLSMPRRGDGQRLLDTLAAAVADDPVQTEVYGLSKLGLVELTRARRGPLLADVLAKRA